MEPLKKVQVEGYIMFAEPELLFGNLDELCCVSFFAIRILDLAPFYILARVNGKWLDSRRRKREKSENQFLFRFSFARLNDDVIVFHSLVEGQTKFYWGPINRFIPWHVTKTFTSNLEPRKKSLFLGSNREQQPSSHSRLINDWQGTTSRKAHISLYGSYVYLAFRSKGAWK